MGQRGTVTAAALLVLLAVVLSPVVLGATEQKDVKVSNRVTESFTEGKEKVKVIVQMEEQASLQARSQAIEVLDKDKVRHRFSSFNGFSATVNQDELERLRQQNDVEKIFYNYPITTHLDDSVPLINANSTWDLQIDGSNLTGKHQTVCVVDSGVDYNHTDLGDGWGGKVIGGVNTADYSENKNCSENHSYCMDSYGHGTHVAGIVAANGSVTGVAPDANIFISKSMGDDGSGDPDDIVAGIEQCIDKSEDFNITTISMSLGTEAPDLFDEYCDEDHSLFAEPINKAVGENITVVAATGNDHNETHISSPACIENATRVGATNKNDTLATSYSNQWDKDMLVAPGTEINSTMIEDNNVQDCSSGDKYCKVSGTSMATPHVSGAVAIMNQYLEIKDRKENVSYIEDVLTETGKEIEADGRTYPRLDVLEATASMSNFFEVNVRDPVDGNKFVENESIIVNYTVENTGEEEGTEEVALNVINGSNVSVYKNDSKDITLEPGEESSGNFTWETEGFEGGDYELKVSSDYSSDSRSIQLLDIYNVTFNVTNTTGDNITDASFVLKSDTGGLKTTDENGEVSYQDVFEGNYTYYVAKEGYNFVNEVVEINSTNITITMEKAQDPKQLNFSVEDSEGPVQGAMAVVLIDTGGDEEEDVVPLFGDIKYTDSQGHAFYEALERRGDYMYVVDREYYKQEVNNFTLQEKKTINVTLELKEGAYRPYDPAYFDVLVNSSWTTNDEEVGPDDNYTVGENASDSIQGGINLTVENESVGVYSGLYNESKGLWNFENVTELVSLEPWKARVNITGNSSERIHVDSNGTTVKGLNVTRDFQETEEPWVRAMEITAGNVSLIKNKLSGEGLNDTTEGQTGILVNSTSERNTTNVHISDNEITNFREGILVTDGPDQDAGMVDNLTIAENIIEGNEYGTVLANNNDTEDLQPTNLSLEKNILRGSGTGLYISGNENWGNKNYTSFDTTELNLFENRFEQQGTHLRDNPGGLDLKSVVDDNSFDIGALVPDVGGSGYEQAISTSVDKATSLAAEGSEVEVLPGKYTEDVVIDTNNLKLTSLEGMENTTVNASASKEDSPYAIEITAENVTLDGFTVENTLGSGDNVVFVDHGPQGNTTLLDNRFVAVSGYESESGKTEFSVETKSRLVAENNSFVEEGTTDATLTHGIGGTDADAADSVIRNNWFGPGLDEVNGRSEGDGEQSMTTGIQMAGADNVTVEGNTFVDVWGSAVIFNGDVENATVLENDIYYANSGVVFLSDESDSNNITGELLVNRNNFFDLGAGMDPDGYGVFVGENWGTEGSDNVSEVDGRENWWGTYNKEEINVSEGVVYWPWFNDTYQEGEAVGGLPAVETLDEENVTYHSVDLPGNLTSMGVFNSTNLSLDWKNIGGDWNRVEVETGREGLGTYNTSIEDLDSNTSYRFRAVSEVEENGDNYTYKASTREFKTESYVKTLDPERDYTETTLRGNLTDMPGGNDWANVSFMYTDGSEWNETNVTNATSAGTFTETIDVEVDNDYKYYAVVRWEDNETVENTGGNVSFDIPERPNIDTVGSSDVNSDSATLEAEITNLGLEDELDEAFIQYRKDGSDDWDDADETEGIENINSEEKFEDEVSGLDPNTTYEFRAVLWWGDDGEDGGTEEFTTEKTEEEEENDTEEEQPSMKFGSVDTLPEENITDSSAVLVGDVAVMQAIDSVDAYFRYREADGGSWSETSWETITDTGEFEAEADGLSHDTAYEFEAVIEWNDGDEESIGDMKTFTTERLGPEIVDRWPKDGEEDLGNEVNLTMELKHPYNYEMNVRFLDEDTGNMIDEIKGVGNEEVNTSWFGLSHNETYRWEVEVHDGHSYTSSDVFEFHTTTQQEVSQTEAMLKDNKEKVESMEEDIEKIKEEMEDGEISEDYENTKKLLVEAEEAVDEGDYGTAMSKLEEAETKRADLEKRMAEAEEEMGGSWMFWAAVLVILAGLGIAIVYYYRNPRRRGQKNVGSYTYKGSKGSESYLNRLKSLFTFSESARYSYNTESRSAVRQKLKKLKKKVKKGNKQKKYDEF